MIRMLGVFCLSGGAVLIGNCAVRHLKARVAELQNLILGLNVMLREMDYRLAPLPELLALASSRTVGQASEFFCLCARGAEHLNGRTFQMIWKQALEAGQLRLEQEDLAVLVQLGGFLGRYDGESQRLILEQTIGQMEEQRKYAKELSDRLGKVYRALSLAAGAFVLILMS